MLFQQYQDALQERLSPIAPDRRDAGAQEFGRLALAEGLSLSELAALHHEALAAVLGSALSSQECLRRLECAQSFFAQAMAPFDAALRAARQADSAFRQLNDRLEEEAKRIAHALHDEAGQLLAAVHIALEDAARELPCRGCSRLREVLTPLDQIEQQLRRLSHELRPTILDDLGVIPAVEFLAQGVSRRRGLQVKVEGSTGGRLASGIETALYRICQEALNNAVRHAQAQQVNIRIERRPDSVRCAIRDDGCGFDVASATARLGKRGLGLIGIQERLSPFRGTLEIDSAAGRGTEIRVSIPIPRAGAAAKA